MKKIDIREKLNNIDVSLEDLMLGDFDAIGRFTAERTRDVNHPLYKSAGCFYRSNYERGILIYHFIICLIKIHRVMITHRRNNISWVSYYIYCP